MKFIGNLLILFQFILVVSLAWIFFALLNSYGEFYTRKASGSKVAEIFAELRPKMKGAKSGTVTVNSGNYRDVNEQKRPMETYKEATDKIVSHDNLLANVHYYKRQTNPVYWTKKLDGCEKNQSITVEPSVELMQVRRKEGINKGINIR